MADYGSAQGAPKQDKREYYQYRMASLRNERSSFLDQYRECSEFVSPRKGRYTRTDRNKGDKRFSSIINSKASKAHKVFRAGMMSGAVSSVTPWFKLATPDDDLNRNYNVKKWLEACEKKIRRIFSESNFYGMVSQMMGEAGQFATGIMTHIDDYQDVARFYTHTAGSYVIDQNDRQVIDVLGREFQQTAKWCVERFGKNAAKCAQDSYDKGDYGAWYDVAQFIHPNAEYQADGMLSKHKQYRSVYYMPGAEKTDAEFCEEKGFKVFPAYCLRWDVTDGDIYGTDCPAMTALGDIKQLQNQEKRLGQAIDLGVRPMLHGPASIRTVAVNGMPGGLTTYDGMDKQKLEPVYQPNVPLDALRMNMQAVEERIADAWYNDLWRAITDMKGIQPRNELDLTKREQERLLQIGDPLGRVNNEVLGPVVARVFARGLEVGIFPPPPRELAGQYLTVRYISSLALAAQSVLAGPLQQLVSFVIGMLAAPALARAGDKLNVDFILDSFGESVGAPAESLYSTDQVTAMREQQAQQQQQAQELASANSIADTAQKAGGAVQSFSNAAQQPEGGQPNG